MAKYCSVPSCGGSTYDPKDKYCSRCGSFFESALLHSLRSFQITSVVCQFCGVEQPASRKYCGRCGKQVVSTVQLERPSLK